MRKFVIALSLISCITSAHALFGGRSQSDAFNGFYAGAAAGIASNMADVSVVSTVTGQGAPLAIGNNESWDTYELNPWGELYAGWGCRFASCFYLGGRVGVNFSSFSQKNDTSSGTLTFLTAEASVNDVARTKLWVAEPTFDLKPGIVFCEKTMVFGIVGVAWNRHELDHESTFLLQVPGSVDVVEKTTFKGRKTRAALRVGLGLECMITRCVSLHASYVYTYYGKSSVTGERTFNIPDPVDENADHRTSFKSRASKGVASIGISYYL